MQELPLKAELQAGARQPLLSCQSVEQLHHSHSLVAVLAGSKFGRVRNFTLSTEILCTDRAAGCNSAGEGLGCVEDRHHLGSAEEAVFGLDRAADSEEGHGLDSQAVGRSQEVVDLGQAEGHLGITGSNSSDTVEGVHHSHPSFDDDSQEEVVHGWEEGLFVAEEGSLDRRPGCKSGIDRVARAGIRLDFADCTYLWVKEIF